MNYSLCPFSFLIELMSLRPKGAKIIATILLTQKATTEQLNRAAA